MFKSLKEKFTSWFKKSEAEEKKSETKEEKLEEKKEEIAEPKKETKEKPAQKKEKKLKKKEKSKPIEEKLEKKETLQEQFEELEKQLKKQSKETPAEKQEQIQEIQEEKQGFFKKLFSKKKKEEKIEIKEPEIKQIQEIQEEKQGFFAKLASKLSTSTLTQEQFDEIFPELEITLLENNVALEVVDKIKESLSKNLVGIEIKKAEIQKTILNSLKESINSILIEPPDLISQIKKSLDIFIIIFVGINGSGKTTTIAKIAHYLKKHKISCILAAADTFRAASIEQLQIHAKNLDIPIIAHQYGSDPAAVAFDAKKYAETHKIKVVLIDTAGRMYTKTNLIKEMEKIVRISKPNLKLFIGESITGNDATEQAKTFNESINIDGIILTKADVDEKAGAILSVSQVTSKPIYFLGTGQNYEDLVPFTKETVLKNLGLE